MAKNSNLDCLIGRISFDEKKIAFPQDLTREQERELFKKLRANYDRAIEEKIAYHNIRFAYKLVRKFYSNTDMEESFLCALLGLTKAIKIYDPEQASSFKNYLFRVMDNEVKAYLRYLKSRKNYDNFCDIIMLDKHGDSVEFEDMVVDNDGDVENITIENERESSVNLLVGRVKAIANKTLSPFEYRAFCCYYGYFGNKTKTQQEIGDELGVTRSYVSRLANQALEKLKDVCSVELADDAKKLGYIGERYQSRFTPEQLSHKVKHLNLREGVIDKKPIPRKKKNDGKNGEVVLVGDGQGESAVSVVKSEYGAMMAGNFMNYIGGSPKSVKFSESKVVGVGRVIECGGTLKFSAGFHGCESDVDVEPFSHNNNEQNAMVEAVAEIGSDKASIMPNAKPKHLGDCYVAPTIQDVEDFWLDGNGPDEIEK